MKPKKALIALVYAPIIGLVALGITYRPEIKRSPMQSTVVQFGSSDVARGSELAAVGDCVVCHTAEGGRPYAGGLPMATPFGVLFSSNITPEETTGIGDWSKEAFKRAMDEGVGRDGSHLYPAFPYDHYTHVSDNDLDDLYAFIMTRTKVVATSPPNKMIFPLGFRPMLEGWKLLFLRKEKFPAGLGATDELDRGKYLVEGLGHCGDCHTPRDIVGGEKHRHDLEGGVAEGWNAPSLTSSNRSVLPWTAADLYQYLRTGTSSNHGTAAGPMAPVTENLGHASDSDVHAIAVYIASLTKGMPAGAEDRQGAFDDIQRAAHENPEGSAVFAGACGGCHESGAPMMAAGRPSISIVTAIQEDDPRNTIQAILQGLRPPPSGEPGAYMPPFAGTLTDTQIAQVAAYLRSRFTRRPSWPGLSKEVSKIRETA
jgi:nicotinate dehydrogenase subunit B